MSLPFENVAAQSVGNNSNYVTQIGEACAFKLRDGIVRRVHCPVGLGPASLEASLLSGEAAIIACDGKSANEYKIYGATLR